MTALDSQLAETLCIIGDARRPAISGARMEIRDPADLGRIVGYAADGSREDVRQAIAAAQDALPAWAALTVHERADYLRAAASALGTDLQPRIELLVREHGMIRPEAEVEMARLGARVTATAELADVVAAETTYPAPPFETVVTAMPMGVVGLIIPWNRPLSILAAKLPHALLAGNTTVIKPSEYSPLATMQTIDLIAGALPPGVINAVTGDRQTTGPELVANPAVRKISLTGSVRTGMTVMAAAAKDLKRVTLELGGNDAGIVLSDARVDEESLERMVLGAFLTAGQVCMALKRLYVHESLYPTVLDGFRSILSDYVVGHGLDPEVTMGPINNRMQLDKVRALVDASRGQGARVEQFGRLKDRSMDDGFFHTPTLITEVAHNASIVTEEQFGPVLPIMPFADEDEAIALANDSEFGLCSSVWSQDLEHATSVARRISAGYTYINHHGPLAQDNRAPFGGVRHSGIGRQLGIAGVREFQEPHSITVFSERNDMLASDR